LFAVSTMGFRGEALPSICAISQVEMKTRPEETSIGTRLVINGSHVETQEPVVCDKGTNIMVKNLFFNTPARRKFLKSDNVETSNVMREFERLALVNNNIRMSIDTGSRVIELRAGTFKQRIGDIWKNNLDLHLLPINVDTLLIKITGFISRPEYARRRNPLQYLIVNGRNMRHPYFHKAIMNCYESLIAADTQPCYFLKFDVDPSSIDVNIHPTKNEIKFEYEQEIWPILQASVKAALGKYGAVPSIDFNSDVLPVDPLPEGELPEQPTLDIPENYNPFAAVSPGNFDGGEFLGRSSSSSAKWNKGNRRDDQRVSNWDKLYSEFIRGKREEEKSFSEIEIKEEEDSDVPLPGLGEPTVVSNFCLQHASRYIITTSREGLMVIDQYRAHVRILFDQYMKKAAQGGLVSQGVLFADTLTLDPEQREVLKDVTDELTGMGFALEYEEEDKWKITGVPAILKNADPRDLIYKIIESIMENSENYGNEGLNPAELTEKIALAMARSSAIPRGKKLSDDEMEHLVGELFSLPNPLYTPNGNRIYYLLDDNKLQSFFR
ncbi:MAG: DNA mismatch repair endonuclease MutL, partial [Muribaculaceae bacterium]|nr:DNA mismatch repair endonuclease MutL [Muribaculaceae bacterium]